MNSVSFVELKWEGVFWESWLQPSRLRGMLGLLMPPPPADVSIPSFSWEGAYIGGQFGGSWADSDLLVRAGDRPRDDLFNLSAHTGGFVGGLYAGYNFDVGIPAHFVFGIETDFVWGSADSRTNTASLNQAPARIFPPDGLDIVGRSHIKQKWAGATRLRAAYAFDRWLPYIAAGIAYSRVKFSTDIWFTDEPDVVFTDGGKKTLIGWTIGGGVDYAATDNVLIRLEYRYADYGEKTWRGDVTQSTYKAKHKTHDLRFGLAYKF